MPLHQEMERLRYLFDDLNAGLYNPVGLNMLWPRDVAFLFVRRQFLCVPLNSDHKRAFLGSWRSNTTSVTRLFRICASGTDLQLSLVIALIDFPDRTFQSHIHTSLHSSQHTLFSRQASDPRSMDVISV
jgi:hypothetical protein